MNKDKKKQIWTTLIFLIVAEVSTILGVIGVALNKVSLFSFLVAVLAFIGAYLVNIIYFKK